MSWSTGIKTVLLLLWLAAVSWLIRYEAFPHRFEDTVRGYPALARQMPAIRDTWMKVLYDGDHVGYVNSSIEIEEEEGRERVVMRTNLQIRLRMGNGIDTLQFDSEVRLSSRQELLGSESDFSFGRLKGAARLEPMKGEGRYRLVTSLNGMEWAREVRLPRDAILASPLLDAGLRNIRPGRTLRVRTIDPLSPGGEPRTLEITAGPAERRQPPGYEEPVEVTRLTMRMGEIEFQSLVDEYGRIVWQETPFGLLLVRTEPRLAMRVPSDNAVSPADLMSASPFSSFNPMPGVP